jgi:orotate phosphoribosyltransferase
MNDRPPDLRLVDLLRRRSLRTGTFTLASGRTSSYYIDARVTTMSAAGLKLVGELGLAAIRRAGWGVDVVGGLTLGADPVAYAIARASQDTPPAVDAFTVRKQAKEHGIGRRIEGCFHPGVRAVVVEDVITSGASARSAIEAVTAEGGIVTGVLAVVDRQEGGRAAIEAGGVPVVCLVNVSDLGVEQ